MEQALERPVSPPPPQQAPKMPLPGSDSDAHASSGLARTARILSRSASYKKLGGNSFERQIIQKMGHGRRHIFVCMRILK